MLQHTSCTQCCIHFHTHRSPQSFKFFLYPDFITNNPLLKYNSLVIIEDFVLYYSLYQFQRTFLYTQKSDTKISQDIQAIIGTYMISMVLLIMSPADRI